MREWCKLRVLPLAQAIARASASIVAVTGQPFTTPEHLGQVQRVLSGDVSEVDMPLVDEATAEHWRAALHALRALSEPLPWHVEGAADAVAAAIEQWIAAGEANRAQRRQLLEDFHDAMRDGREDDVIRLVNTHQVLLGKAEVGRAGRFWLRRLRFDQASRLRAHSSEVPRPLEYFAPLLLGVAGAPLSSIQTDKIWSPLLTEATAGDYLKYAFVLVPMLGISLYLLYSDLEKGMSDLRLGEILRRALRPLVLLLAINYGVNAIVWASVAKAEAHDAGLVATTAMWGTLSLFLGVFLGLIAQGRRMVDE
jgi:hypothetical protein